MRSRNLSSSLGESNAGNAGTVEAEQNFDAWGRKRNTTNWTYASVAAPPAWLYRGYTGHEHLPQFNLINMNGRLYDPLVGRMLSTDNHVQEPGSTQNFNRYSYALNNPLKYTDPDGELFLSGLVGFVDGFFSTSTNRFQAGWNEAARRADHARCTGHRHP